jgi:hypothetical protein
MYVHRIKLAVELEKLRRPAIVSSSSRGVWSTAVGASERSLEIMRPR